jgi:uncharacterized membrane protein (UPF0127 family)
VLVRLHFTLAVIVFAILATMPACGDGGTPAPVATAALPQRVTVTVGDASFDAEVSETSAERSLGLGERDSLAPNAGMLFVFKSEGEHGFWMKGMRFPLDFVWISADRQVVALTENVQPPEPGTPDEELELFDEDVASQYVLEINAGAVAASGIALGDVVSFAPEIDPTQAE